MPCRRICPHLCSSEDIDAVPVEVQGRNGAVMVAHSGMLASARALEVELRFAVRELVDAGYTVIFTGHSLGGAVAALLVWLLQNCSDVDGKELPRHANVFGIGYGMPSVVDRDTAKAMRPVFTSVVNAMDAVPRLSVESLSRLGEELSACAQESGSDLDQDVQHYLERLGSVWAPRIRDGTPAASSSASPSPSPSPDRRGARPGLGGDGSDGSEGRAGLPRVASADSVAGVPRRLLERLGAWPQLGRAGAGAGEGAGVPGEPTLLPASVELFAPGHVVWVHRARGHLEASVVPCDLPALRRIVLDKRMSEA